MPRGGDGESLLTTVSPSPLEHHHFELATMHGPPSDCKGKLIVKKIYVNVSGLLVEMCLLAMMRYAGYPSY